MYYEKTTLRDQGLVLNLGHHGSLCPNPGPRYTQLTVADLNGFHKVDVQFCACYVPDTGVVELWRQLFRMQIYSATRDRPSTAFTFRLLDFYDELSSQGKANLYDYHKTLERVTDNSGTSDNWVSVMLLYNIRPYSRPAALLPPTFRCCPSMAAPSIAQTSRAWP